MKGVSTSLIKMVSKALLKNDLSMQADNAISFIYISHFTRSYMEKSASFIIIIKDYVILILLPVLKVNDRVSVHR